MDNFEKIGYWLLGILAGLYIIGLLVGMIAAWPFGVVGLLGFAGIGMLLIKVINDRLRNKDDDYYDKHIDK